MSRSVKKVWAGPNCVCRSCKQDKRIAHGIYRSNVHRLLRVEGDDFRERNEHEFKHGSDWSWACDGHGLYGSKIELRAFVADADDPKKWYHKMLAK